MPDTLKSSARQVFKDEYLLEFITIENGDDEKDTKNKVVVEIKRFYFANG